MRTKFVKLETKTTDIFFIFSAFWKRIGIDVAHPGIGDHFLLLVWTGMFRPMKFFLVRQDSWSRRTPLCALLPVGLLLSLPWGETSALPFWSPKKSWQDICTKFKGNPLLHSAMALEELGSWKGVDILFKMRKERWPVCRWPPWPWILTWASSLRGRRGSRRSWSWTTFIAISGGQTKMLINPMRASLFEHIYI